jgi:uncharacterized membrane protein
VLPQRPCLGPDQRRALELLAKIPFGISADLLAVTHGFDRGMIAGLVEAGLATARSEIVTAPSHTIIEVVRIRISDSGRQVLKVD